MYQSCGRNYVWHVDGYDKLKPFGTAINGCIDGSSRMIFWFEAIQRSLLATSWMLITAGGRPDRLRLDLGRENGHMADMQLFLHLSENEDGPDNQRIERWWLTLRSQCALFWIDLFDKLREDSYFSDNFLSFAFFRQYRYRNVTHSMKKLMIQVHKDFIDAHT